MKNYGKYFPVNFVFINNNNNNDNYYYEWTCIVLVHCVEFLLFVAQPFLIIQGI